MADDVDPAQRPGGQTPPERAQAENAADAPPAETPRQAPPAETEAQAAPAPETPAQAPPAETAAQAAPAPETPAQAAAAETGAEAAPAPETPAQAAAAETGAEPAPAPETPAQAAPAQTPPVGPQAPAAAPPPPRSGGSGKLVAGWILVGLGGLLVVGAIAVAIVHLTQRGNNGYFTSSVAPVSSRGYAVTSEGLDFGDLPSFATDQLGQVRISATSRNGQPLFVGIAPESAVNGYLGGVARNVVTNFDGSTVDSTPHAGGAPAGPPTRQNFWEASASARGQTVVTWKVKGGNWAAVVMNATAAPGVNAGVTLGAKTNILLWAALGLFIIGVILAGGGAALLLSARGAR